MKRRSPFIPIIACILFFAAAWIVYISLNDEDVPVQQADVFDFNPALGSIYHYSVIQDDSSIVAANVFRKNLIRDFSMKCVQKDDTSAQMLITFKEVKQVNSPESKAVISMGEDEEENRRISDSINAEYKFSRESILNHIAGKTMYVTLGRNAKILAINGFEQIVQNITNKTTKARGFVKSTLKELIGPASLQDMFTNIFFYFPGTDLHKGSNWINNLVLISKAPVKHSNLITVKDIRGDSVIMDVQTSISARAAADGPVFMEGKRLGNLVASKSTGMIYNFIAKEDLVTKTDIQDYNHETSIQVTALENTK